MNEIVRAAARARWRKRHANPEKRARINQLKREWRLLNLEKCRAQEVARSKRYNGSVKFDWPKYRARQKLRAAVRDGRLQKPERCQRCNRLSDLHGHHNDYSKPFDVAWLCGDCHRHVHRIA